MPNSPGYDRFCTWIAVQTGLLRSALDGADLDARVPTCPDWTLRRLVGHLGGAHRWAAELVRTRATGPVPGEAVPGYGGPDGAGTGNASPEALDAWLAEGAELLVETLRNTDPDTYVWSPFNDPRAAFVARRMAHETALHRADVCLSVGAAYTLAPEQAADCMDEWLEIVSSPLARESKSQLRSLDVRAGDTLHLHATDTAGPDLAGGPAEWVVEFHTDGLTWRRAHEKSTVALRGPLTEVLLAFLRRMPVSGGELEVLGDEGLLDLWLEHVSF